MRFARSFFGGAFSGNRWEKFTFFFSPVPSVKALSFIEETCLTIIDVHYFIITVVGFKILRLELLSLKYIIIKLQRLMYLQVLL